MLKTASEPPITSSVEKFKKPTASANAQEWSFVAPAPGLGQAVGSAEHSGSPGLRGGSERDERLTGREEWPWGPQGPPSHPPCTIARARVAPPLLRTSRGQGTPRIAYCQTVHRTPNAPTETTAVPRPRGRATQVGPSGGGSPGAASPGVAEAARDAPPPLHEHPGASQGLCEGSPAGLPWLTP